MYERGVENFGAWKGCYRKRKYYFLYETWKQLQYLRNKSAEAGEDPARTVVYRCPFATHMERHFHIGHIAEGHEDNVVEDHIILASVRSEESRLYKLRMTR